MQSYTLLATRNGLTVSLYSRLPLSSVTDVSGYIGFWMGTMLGRDMLVSSRPTFVADDR